MKTLLVLALSLFTANAFAIEFITEEQVQAKLGADKVIEISDTGAEKLVEPNSACSDAILSRSSRSYVVKKGTESFVFVTASGLSTLLECGSL